MSNSSILGTGTLRMLIGALFCLVGVVGSQRRRWWTRGPSVVFRDEIMRKWGQRERQYRSAD